MTRLNFLAYVKRIFKRTDKDTEIYEALNETIKDIGTRGPFPGYAFTSYTPCVVEQEDYPLPTDLLHISHPIKLLDGSATGDSGAPLEFISKAEYDIREPNPNRTSPATGKPTAYTIYSNQIMLTPIPDSTDYLIEIDWGKIPPSLSADSDTAAFQEVGDEVIKWGTLWRLFAGVGLYEDADYWRNLYEGGVERMKDIARDKEKTWVETGSVNEL